MSEFAEFIRAWRKEAGLTLRQAGEVIGVAESTVSLWEAGRRRPPVKRAITIDEVLEKVAAYRQEKQA